MTATINTQVKAGALEIDNGPDHKAYITPTKPVKVDITGKDLKDLRFESAGEVTVEGLHTTDFKALLKGAGSLNLSDVVLKSLEATLSGVGSVKGTGSATELDVRVDGLGSFDGAALH